MYTARTKMADIAYRAVYREFSLFAALAFALRKCRENIPYLCGIRKAEEESTQPVRP